MLEERVEAEASGEGGSLATKGWHVEAEQCLRDIRGRCAKGKASVFLTCFLPTSQHTRSHAAVTLRT